MGIASLICVIIIIACDHVLRGIYSHQMYGEIYTGAAFHEA